MRKSDIPARALLDCGLASATREFYRANKPTKLADRSSRGPATVAGLRFLWDAIRLEVLDSKYQSSNKLSGEGDGMQDIDFSHVFEFQRKFATRGSDRCGIATRRARENLEISLKD